MKFLIDNQLPPALARLIQAEFGFDAAHVTELGLAEAADQEIWQRATADRFVVISKDEDFTSMAITNDGASLIWVRVGNCRSGFLLEVFRRVWPKLLQRLEAGDRFIEIR